MNNIPRIKLEDGMKWEEFIKSNELDFWKMTINASKRLIEGNSQESTAFILHGGKLTEEKEFVVKLTDIEETLDKGLAKMEELEQYEECSRIMDIKKSINF